MSNIQDLMHRCNDSSSCWFSDLGITHSNINATGNIHVFTDSCSHHTGSSLKDAIIFNLRLIREPLQPILGRSAKVATEKIEKASKVLSLMQLINRPILQLEMADG